MKCKFHEREARRQRQADAIARARLVEAARGKIARATAARGGGDDRGEGK